MLQQAGKMGVDVVLQHFRVGQVLRVAPAAVGVFKYGQEGEKVGNILQHSILQTSWTNGGRGYQTWCCNTSESGVAAFKSNVACKRAGKMGVDAALQHFRQVLCVAPAAVIAYRIS